MSTYVETKYQLENVNELWRMNEVAEKAAGRFCDRAGTWLATLERDMQWDCETEEEAKRIKLALEAVGLTAEIRNYDW